MYSDNGTNFTSVNKQMQKAYEEVLHIYCSGKRIEWNFIPPTASHYVGSWERMIRTICKVFSGIIDGTGRMTDEILHTFFYEVESIINGRPLTKVSDDVTDAAPLTPNHLLLLRGNPSEALVSSLPNDVFRGRWRFVKYLAGIFGRRWTREYLTKLQKRFKWLFRRNNLSIGDLVLLLDENTPCSLWPLGLVIGASIG